MQLYREARDFPLTLRGRCRVVGTADLEAVGISARAATWQAGRGRLVRPYRGTYLLGTTRPDLLDHIRAALAVCPPGTLVGYHTAAALFGFGVVPSTDIHVIIPPDGSFPRRRGIAAHRSGAWDTEPVLIRGVACAPAARCAVDLARGLARVDALSVLDAALAAGACTPDDLAKEIAVQARLRGIQQARGLVAMADGRSQCRQETQLRLILLDAALTDFVPQVRVSDGGRTYYLDLGDPVAKVAAEYDGSSHLDRGHLRTDRERHNWLETRGWRMRYFTDLDLYRRPFTIPRILRAAQAAQRSRSSS